MPLYNMDKIKKWYDDYDNCINDDCISSYEYSYIKSCNSYLGNLGKNIQNEYERLEKGGLNILTRWDQIISSVEKLDQEIASEIDAIASEFGTGNSLNAILIAQGIVTGLSGISASYNSIELGGKVGDYNVSKGHDTATWAVDGKNVEDLNAKYVTKESKFMRFAVINEDGSIGYISNEKGITLEQFCVDNNVPPERVAVDVGSKDGKSQAWVSVKELTDGVASTNATSSGMKGTSNASTSNSATTNVNTTGASSQGTPNKTSTNSPTNTATSTSTASSQTSDISSAIDRINSNADAIKKYDTQIKNKEQYMEKLNEKQLMGGYDYEEEINKLKNEVDSLEDSKKRSTKAIYTDIANLETKIKNKEQYMEKLNEKQLMGGYDYEEEINKLKSEINSLKGYKNFANDVINNS